jgi:hypothetical protein
MLSVINAARGRRLTAIALHAAAGGHRPEGSYAPAKELHLPS